MNGQENEYNTSASKSAVYTNNIKMIQIQIVQVTEVLSSDSRKDLDFINNKKASCDVTLACDDNHFEAHKTIISSPSLASVFPF